MTLWRSLIWVGVILDQIWDVTERRAGLFPFCEGGRALHFEGWSAEIFPRFPIWKFMGGKVHIIFVWSESSKNGVDSFRFMRDSGIGVTETEIAADKFLWYFPFLNLLSNATGK